MTRSLLLGCAVAACAVYSGSASAQSKFDVTIGGDAFFQAGIVQQNQDNNLRSVDFRNRFRLAITPTAKTDSGLEYGARVRIRANNNTGGVDTDRAFVFANGKFGTVRLGVLNGLGDEYAQFGPNVEGFAGGPDNNSIDFLSPTTALGGSGNVLTGGAVSVPAVMTNLRTLYSGDLATKAVYLTPDLFGLQLGVAYTPTTNHVFNPPPFQNMNAGVNRVKTVTGSNERAEYYNDMVELGGLYTREIGAWTVSADVYYSTGTGVTETLGLARTSYDRLSSIHAGTTIGYGALKFGGSYAYSGTSGYSKSAAATDRDAQTVYTVGAQYALNDKLTLATNYTFGRDAGLLTVDGASRMSWVQAGATYAVAPGLTVGAEYGYFNINNNDAPGTNDHGNLIVLDTRIAF
jgi:predicted porin